MKIKKIFNGRLNPRIVLFRTSVNFEKRKQERQNERTEGKTNRTKKNDTT